MMAVLFVICVRLSEILYQKALQPKRPGISGVRQLYQLNPIQVPPFVPNVTHPFSSQAQAFISGGGHLVIQQVHILEVYDQSPCCGSIAFVQQACGK